MQSEKCSSWIWKRFATFLDRQIVNPKFTNRGIWLTTVIVTFNLAATILVGYDWLEPEDIQACLEYARRLAAH